MILQTNVDAAVAFFAARVGTQYVYGGMFSPTDTSQGTDCSGMCDTILRILTTGNGGPLDVSGHFIRTVDTESWPYDYTDDLAVAVGTVSRYGTVCAGDAQPGPPPTVYPPQIPSDAAAIIYLMHQGGGQNSHMMINVNGVVMETGGDHNDTGGNGQYASPNGAATSTTDPEWTDIWYLPGPIQGAPTPPPGPTPLVAALRLKGFSPELIRLIEGFSIVEGLNPAGNPTLGWTDAQLGGDTSLQGHVDALAQQFIDREPVAGVYPQGGTDLAQAQWIAKVVGQAGVIDWQGHQQPSDYVQRVVAAMQNFPLPTPVPGDDMAAVPQAQWDQLFTAICGEITSESALAKPGEGPIWTVPQLIRNIDSFTNPMYVEWAAGYGQPWAMSVLASIAAVDVTANPGEAENVALATAILARLASQPGPVPSPVPTPVPGPAPTPAPAPAPTPAPVTPPGSINISVAQLLAWGKEALTILGAIGTWATAVHGQIVGLAPGTTAAALVPATLAATTTVLAGHTVHQKHAAVKELTQLKGTP